MDGGIQLMKDLKRSVIKSTYTDLLGYEELKELSKFGTEVEKLGRVVEDMAVLTSSEKSSVWWANLSKKFTGFKKGQKKDVAGFVEKFWFVADEDKITEHCRTPAMRAKTMEIFRPYMQEYKAEGW